MWPNRALNTPISHNVHDNRALITKISDHIHEHVSRCMITEELYRFAGIKYHTTQLTARQPNVFPQDKLTELAHMFQTSSVSEYNAIFADLYPFVAKLTDIRVRYARTHGTAEQLKHRLTTELKPRYAEAYEEFDAVMTRFHDCFEVIKSLSLLSVASHEEDANGVRRAWHDVSWFDRQRSPAVLGEEWIRFRVWVSSLPETEFSVKRGRNLNQVALGMLWIDEERFVSESCDVFTALVDRRPSPSISTSSYGSHDDEDGYSSWGDK